MYLLTLPIPILRVYTESTKICTSFNFNKKTDKGGLCLLHFTFAFDLLRMQEVCTTSVRAVRNRILRSECASVPSH